MDSRTLTTASISKKLSQEADSSSITAAHIATASSATDIANDEQAKLDHIANQASNMPYGVGIILSKTLPIERLSNLCSGIRDFISDSQVGLWASIFWGIESYSVLKNSAIEVRGAQLENQCQIVAKSGSESELVKLCDTLSKLSWDLKIGVSETFQYDIHPMYAGYKNTLIESHSLGLEKVCRDIVEAKPDSRSPAFRK